MNFNERKFGIWLAVALALLCIVFVIRVMGVSDLHDEGSKTPFVVGGILSGIVILAGLRYERSNLRVGGIITIVGALPFGLLMFWLVTIVYLPFGLLMFWLVIPGIIAIAVAALTVRRTFTSRTLP